MLKFKRILLPDGTYKIEAVPESPEIIAERQRIRLENHKKVYEKSAKNAGFNNRTEYDNYNEELYSIKKGFKDLNEFRRVKSYKYNRSIPLGDNPNCASYLGVYIAENVLSKIFEDVKRMPINNPGYDFLCKYGYKIDVKSSCLHNNIYFTFSIKENKNADYFLLIGFDDRENLNVLHIWLIKGEEIIYNISSIELIKNHFNDLKGIGITNSKRGLSKYKKYELTDKLDKVKEICSEFKEKILVE